MYHKILLPLDGSPFSEEALPLAVGVARRTGAELRIIHVAEPLIGEIFLEMGKGTEAQLQALAARVTAKTGVPARAELLAGKALPEILGYISGEGIDLVVVATHGWGGLQRAWLGSTTDALVRAAPVPILAMHPRGRTPAATPPAGTIPGTGESTGATLSAAEHTARGAELLAGTIAHRPLIPLDGSTLAESAIDPLVDLVGPDAHYTLLRIVQIPIPPDPMTGSWAPDLWQQQIPAMQQDAKAYLDDVASRLAGRVRSVETAIRTELGAAPAILEFARERQADLIAISTRGHGGLKRLALGSVADKVLRGADLPVLLKGPGIAAENGK